jgi:hypothetical protein
MTVAALENQIKRAAADIRRPLLCLNSLFRMKVRERPKRLCLIQRGGLSAKGTW